MLSFQCPGCQRKLSIPDPYAGKKIKCPGCGNVTVAPKSTMPEAPPIAAVLSTTPPGNPNEPTKDFSVKQSVDPAFVQFLAPPKGGDEIGRLGKYRILGIIGQGGMGIVYKAEDTMAQRLVAIKAILPSLGASEHMRKRFLREARVLAKLDHDGVVRLYEVNEERGVTYIAMELLTGKPLDKHLQLEPRPAITEAVRIGREVAAGLAMMHERELIHRDIKPANIFLTGAGRKVKILDFGLARVEDDESRLTASGAVLGTPSYMAPEQSRGEKVDFRCDLFSLGVLLYRLTTGVEPFRGEDTLSTLMAIANDTPQAPQMVNFDVPSALSDLIMQLLEKTPAQRGTAREVVDTLTYIEKGEPVPERKTKPVEADEEDSEWQEIAKSKSKAKAKSSSFPWLIVAIVVGVLFLCIAIPAIVAAILIL